MVRLYRLLPVNKPALDLTHCDGTMKRWPILKNMRHHIPMALKSIQCCCILENICRDWNEEDPEDNDDTDNTPDAGDVASDAGAAGVGAAMQLTRGNARRLQLMDQMNL